MIGQRIGPYDVLAKLGEGGMGEVYRARDSKLKREVALKVLPADVAGDRDRLARFQREAEVLAALNHPNIAHIHGLEEAHSTTALVMELVEGEDLAERIARGSLPIDEAIAIAKQIADALEAAHEQGIIHRDLKPANVKVRPDGTVKVLDFGLAKALQDPKTSSPQDLSASPTITSPAMTMRGVILGTAAYMSPEQAKGKAVDKRTDIWAFGCVLYEMLSGTRAFEGEDVTDTIAAVVTREPDWSRLPASTPAAVRRSLARCLAKDRKHRLRDIGDAHHELTDDAQGANAPSPVPTARAAWMATAAAGLAAVLLAIPAISHFRETAPAERALRLTIDAPANAVRLLGPEISPDGRSVGFASIGSSSSAPQLWIRRLDESAPAPVPGPIFVNGSHFWSPDSRAIAALTREGLLHLDLATGGTRILTPARSTMVGLAQFSGTWGPDGVILYGLGGTIHRVSEHGGDSSPVALEGLAPGAESRFPVFLPGGRRFPLPRAGSGPVVHLCRVDRRRSRHALVCLGLAGRVFRAVTRPRSRAVRA
jgi:serine/threonine protein kinase